MLKTNKIKKEKNVRNTKTNVGANASVRPNAITLVALVITVIILIILAGVSLNLALGQNGIFVKSKEAVDKYKDSAQKEQEHLDDTYRELEGINSKEYNLDEGVNKPKLIEGMIPIKYNGTNWVICEESDKDWYSYKEGKKWANVMLSDGKYTTKETLGEGQAKATVGQTIEEKDLGSMFVWIPRYAYSIVKYKQQVDSGEGTTQNITDVTFLVGTTNKDINAKTYPTDYKTEDAKVGQATPKIVHPAFTFGGEKLTGIWVAKFEASMKEENKNTTTNNDTIENKTIKIVPNAETWRYIRVGNAFLNCYNMNKDNNVYGLPTSANTHLTKNNEWGAIAYLSASQYGVVPAFCDSDQSYTENGDNTTKYHSYSAGQNYKTNTNQSTTGNETGIYDLNGGAWEYVAAYWDNGNSNLSWSGTTDIFPSNNLDSKYTKYWDKYEVSDTEKEKSKDNTFWDSGKENNKTRKEITDDRYNLMKDKKGDAMYEVIKDYSYYGKKNDGNYEWGKNETFTSADYGRSYYNSDYALIGNTSLPFLIRGGFWWFSSGAGVFASDGDLGNAYYSYRFPSSCGCALAL